MTGGNEVLSGKRTYILAVLIGIVSTAYALKWIDENAYMALLGALNGGAIAALRSGVKKSGPV